MSVIHRFTGEEFALNWEGATHRDYNSPGVKGATGKVLIGPDRRREQLRVSLLPRGAGWKHRVGAAPA